MKYNKSITPIIIAIIVASILGGIYVFWQKTWIKEGGGPLPTMPITTPKTLEGQPNVDVNKENESESLISGGIGVALKIKDKILTISTVLGGSSAENVGLKVGDQIFKIDNVSTQTLSIDEAIKLIKGEPGTEVVLTINRVGWKEQKEFKITRVSLDFSSLTAFVCVIFDPASEFNQKIPSSGKWLEIPLVEPGIIPELNLHAVSPRGQHIGLNYITGKYEMQIPEADPTMISVDNGGAPGWICLPNFVGAKFYVSSYFLEQWIKENPEKAAKMTDTTEKYDIYARYIDQKDIYTSLTLVGQIIKPGEYVVYEAKGVADKVSLSPGIKDDQPPIITYTPLQKEYRLNSPSVIFNFSAEDKLIGLKEVSAKLDGNSITSDQKINFDKIGSHNIIITASDLIGHVTSTTVNFSVIQ